MNRGTHEGNIEEINLVSQLNKNRDDYIWQIMNVKSSRSLYAIHVLKHVYSSYLEKSIKPKADIYVVECDAIEPSTLELKNYVIDENDIELYKMKTIDFSGISVKLSDSSRYQIMKMGPRSFKKIFGSYELGAGASIYCKNNDELKKNDSVLKGWFTNRESFVKYFSTTISNVEYIFDNSIESDARREIAKKLKSYSNEKISEYIKNNEKISEYVFTGRGLYPEPYPASWIYEKGTFRENKASKFTVTTGSGRSRGEYTIVIKPKD